MWGRERTLIKRGVRGSQRGRVVPYAAGMQTPVPTGLAAEERRGGLALSAELCEDHANGFSYWWKWGCRCHTLYTGDRTHHPKCCIAPHNCVWAAYGLQFANGTSGDHTCCTVPYLRRDHRPLGVQGTGVSSRGPQVLHLWGSPHIQEPCVSSGGQGARREDL